MKAVSDESTSLVRSSLKVYKLRDRDYDLVIWHLFLGKIKESEWNTYWRIEPTFLAGWWHWLQETAAGDYWSWHVLEAGGIMSLPVSVHDTSFLLQSVMQRVMATRPLTLSVNPRYHNFTPLGSDYILVIASSLLTPLLPFPSKCQLWYFMKAQWTNLRDLFFDIPWENHLLLARCSCMGWGRLSWTALTHSTSNSNVEDLVFQKLNNLYTERIDLLFPSSYRSFWSL